MASYVTLQHVEDRYGPISDDDLANVNALMDEAEAVLTATIGDLAARIALGRTTAANIAIAAANMVVRVLKNPNGLREESHPEYSYVRDTRLSAGGMILTREDRRLLGVRAGAVTVPIRDDALPWVAERPTFLNPPGL